MSFARVTTNTNNSKYSKRQFTTTRRFSDFLGLHDILVSKYLRCGRIIPPAPQKNIIGECGKLVANQRHKTAISIMNLYGGLSVYCRSGESWGTHGVIIPFYGYSDYLALLIRAGALHLNGPTEIMGN